MKLTRSQKIYPLARRFNPFPKKIPVARRKFTKNIGNSTRRNNTSKNIEPQSEGKRWITHDVKNQCSKKIKLWEKFLDDKSEETKEKFKRQCNKCKQLVRR